jgi:hypothetical protein
VPGNEPIQNSRLCCTALDSKNVTVKLLRAIFH